MKYMDHLEYLHLLEKDKSCRASERPSNSNPRKNTLKAQQHLSNIVFQVFFLYYNSVVHYHPNTVNIHANTSFTQSCEELFMVMQLFPGTKWNTFTTTSGVCAGITALPLMTIPL